MSAIVHGLTNFLFPALNLIVSLPPHMCDSYDADEDDDNRADGNLLNDTFFFMPEHNF